MQNAKKHIVINALHTKTGGGLIFLNHILPLMAKDADLKLTVVAHEKYADVLNIPKNVALEKVNFETGFLKMLLWEQFKLPALVRKLGGEITFNIANYCPLFAPKPVVFVTNNPEVRHYTSNLKSKMYWHALIWMTRFSLLASPLSFSNGDYMKKVYANGMWSFLQKKMIKATTACDVIFDKSIQKKKGQIVAIGDFYVHKNYDLLIKAFAGVITKRTDAKLIIIGREVNADVYENVRYLIALLKLEPFVEIKGFVKHEAAVHILAESEVYVSPSDAEAFSLTLLEAMTVGTASVVKNHNFQYEVSGDKSAEYVEVVTDKKEQIKLLTKGILKILDNTKKRDSIVKSGFEMSIGYSWQKTADTICKNLKSL